MRRPVTARTPLAGPGPVDLRHPVTRTFAVLKPDVTTTRRTGVVLDFIEAHAFALATVVQARLNVAAWAGFYGEHADKPFFDDLCAFMASGPVVLLVLESLDAVPRMRQLLGATDPKAARKGTVRYYYGDRRPGAPVWRNAVHASATPEDFDREALFFLGAGGGGAAEATRKVKVEQLRQDVMHAAEAAGFNYAGHDVEWLVREAFAAGAGVADGGRLRRAVCAYYAEAAIGGGP